MIKVFMSLAVIYFVQDIGGEYSAVLDQEGMNRLSNALHVDKTIKRA